MSEEQFRSRYQFLDRWLDEIEHKLTLNSPAQDDFDFEDPEDLQKRIETNERITFHMKEKETRDKFMGLIPIAKILDKEPTFNKNWVRHHSQLITSTYWMMRDRAKGQRSHLNEEVDRLMRKLIQDIDDLTRLMKERRNLILNSGPDSERLMKSNMEDSFSAIQLLEHRAAHVTKVFSAHRAKVKIQSKMGDLQEKFSDLDEIFSKRHDWFRWVSQVKAEEDWIAQEQEWLERVDQSHRSRELIETSLARLDEFGKDLPVHIRIVNELEGTLSSFKGASPERLQKLKETLDQFGISVAKVKQEMTANLKSFNFYYQAYLTRSLIAEKEKESTNFNEETAHDLESLRTIQTKQDEFDGELESLEKGGVAALHKIKEDMTEDEFAKCDLITKTFDEIIHRWDALVSSNHRRINRIQSLHDNFTQVAIAELRREIEERSEAFRKFLESCRSLRMDTSNPVDAEVDLKFLESLVSDLEIHTGQHEPETRPFILELTPKELDQLQGILMTNLFDGNEKSILGPRMAIVYLQILGRLAQASGATPELRFKIGEKLLNIAFGREEVPIKSKVEVDGEDGPKKETEAENQNQPESSLAGTREQIRKCAMDALHLILSSNYSPEFITLLSNHIIQNSSDFTSKPETLKVFKDIKKATKKYTGGSPHLECILRSYGIRVLLDEGLPISSAGENVQSLLELVKGAKEGEEEELTELWRFITSSVVRERYPPFNYEGLFNKLLMEGKVNDEVVQVFAETIDMELEPEGEEEDEDDESDGESKMEVDQEKDDDDDSEESEDEEESATTTPPKKKTKLDLDPAQIAKLQAELGANSDSEESIALDEATEEDLQRMDGALAKVFGGKKHMKEEERSGERGLMRTLRLVDLYIRRNAKDMPVSSLLILLMPVVHSLQKSLKLRKSQLPTRLIGTLDNLNRVKRFTGCDEVVEGIFATLAGELHDMGLQIKNKLIRELLEHSVLLMTKCFLQKEGKPSKKDQKKFIALYAKAVDIAESKIKGRRKITRKRGKGKKSGVGGVLGDMNTSRFVRLALESFPEWKEGQKAIQERIKSKSEEAK